MSGSRTEQRDGVGAGAFVSALLHGSVIALAVIAWPRLMPPIDLSDQVVPVDILPPADETNIAPREKSDKPLPEPTPQPPPPEPPQAAAEPPPPPPPEAEALATPEPLPPPPIPLKPVSAPPVQRFAMAHPRAKPKPEKAKPDFDINRIAGLVDKMAKEQPKAQVPAAATKPAQASRTVAGAGAQTAMTTSEIDALRSQMMKCWNVPVGAPDPTALVLRLRVALNQDGSVVGMPQLLDTLGLSDPYFRAASESAIRAVKMCGPYKLPVEKYDAWNDVVVTFDPTKMAGY